MPLPTTLDVLAEALAHRDTIREAERQLPDLQKACAAALADTSREAYSGTLNTEQIARIRALRASVRNARARLVALCDGDPVIKDARNVLLALKALRPELAADPEG